MDVSRQNLGSTAAVSNEAPTAIGGVWPVALLLCLQSVLFIAFARGAVGLSAYLSFHLGLCVIATAAWLWYARTLRSISVADNIAMALQLLIWSAVAGPFGTAIAAGLLMPQSHMRDALEQPGLSGSSTNTLSRVERLHNALLDRRLRLVQAHEIRPMMDIIIDGTQLEKFDALRLIGKHYASSAAPALKRAIEDKDASVRVLAATVMAQQHNSFIKRIGERQMAAKAAPDAPDSWTELAQAHLDYARSGLLEASRADSELDQARTHLARAGQLSHDDRLTPTLRSLILHGSSPSIVASHAS